MPADAFSPDQRSAIMRAVKSKNTRPELRLRRGLHALGFRYRLNDARLPGAPDLVFPKRKAVIFVHGCFWHGHDCPRGARPPKTNADYWRTKIARNKARDAQRLADLTALGWRTRLSWECHQKALPAEIAACAEWLASLD